jgi:hypothetical protein
MYPSDSEQHDQSPLSRWQPLLEHDSLDSTSHSRSTSTPYVPDARYPPPKLSLEDASKEYTRRPRDPIVAVPLIVRLPALIIAVLAAGLPTTLLAWLVLKQYRGEGGGIVRVDGSGWALTVLEPSTSYKGSPSETMLVGLIISSIMVSN